MPETGCWRLEAGGWALEVRNDIDRKGHTELILVCPFHINSESEPLAASAQHRAPAFFTALPTQTQSPSPFRNQLPEP